MYTVLVAGPSGSGKSTLTEKLERCLSAHGIIGVRTLETSAVLDQAANGSGLWLPTKERALLREAIRTGAFYDEVKVAKLMLQASEKASLLLICGMRGAQALAHYHQRRPINMVLALRVDDEVAIARLVKQGREETDEVRIARYRSSCQKFVAAVEDATRLGIPTMQIDGNGTMRMVEQQACAVVQAHYRRFREKSV